ncbi:MAG TPA: 30S ribosomal protein S6 [Armatimonadota bacterium]|nr:30S ribosomal protein S6 [Armatimonadota bacterium]
MSEERTLYEAIYILDAGLPEDHAAEIIGAMEGTVAEAGGEVVATQDFGTRRLAYEIDRHVSGVYKLLYFYGGEEAIEAFRHEAAVRQEIVRARCYVANPDAIVRGEAAADVAVAEGEAAEAGAAEAADIEAAEEEPEAEGGEQ